MLFGLRVEPEGIDQFNQLPDNECITQLVLLYSGAGSLSKLFGLIDIQSRKLQLLQSNHNVCQEKLTPDLLHHRCEAIVPSPAGSDRESCSRQPVGVAFQRLSITDTSDPGEKPVQFR